MGRYMYSKTIVVFFSFLQNLVYNFKCRWCFIKHWKIGHHSHFLLFLISETCASLCGGKKERIRPQEPPKRVEIPVYYQEPDESVISLRKLEIPTFKKDV